MARSIKLWAVALMLLATGLQAQDARITIESSITSAEALGPIVKGEMLLTIVNATETELRSVTLRLATPTSGSIGEEGTFSVGTIEIDATVAPRVPFQIDEAFLQGDEPAVITLGYVDAAGETREVNVSVRRKVEGGGL